MSATRCTCIRSELLTVLITDDDCQAAFLHITIPRRGETVPIDVAVTPVVPTG